MYDIRNLKVKKVKTVIIIILIIVFIFVIRSFLLSLLGHVPIPDGPQIVREKENICIDFFIVDPEYTTVGMYTYDCSNFKKIDSLVTKECASVSIKKTKTDSRINIREDSLCSSFGPCTEGRKPGDTCHWDDVLYTIDSSGYFKFQP